MTKVQTLFFAELIFKLQALYALPLAKQSTLSVWSLPTLRFQVKNATVEASAILYNCGMAFRCLSSLSTSSMLFNV
jgi:hypothetical protein